MKTVTSQCIAKAEEWYTSANSTPRESRPDHAAFMAQESARWYLEAVLVEAGATLSYEEDLAKLVDLALPAEPALGQMRDPLGFLANFDESVLYPGKSATADDASKALEVAGRVREIARRSLALPESGEP